jgi:hypothetical protein
MEIMWANRPLEVRFDVFQKLVKQGWKIELERIDQISNGEWLIDETTGLPIPNQITNRFGDIPLVSWTTYVYPPDEEDWIECLNTSFSSPLKAYAWLAPRLDEYAKEWKKHMEDA